MAVGAGFLQVLTSADGFCSSHGGEGFEVLGHVHPVFEGVDERLQDVCVFDLGDVLGRSSLGGLGIRRYRLCGLFAFFVVCHCSFGFEKCRTSTLAW